jgi:hypothetical protein
MAILAEDGMIIPEVSPMLTCVATSDGYLYELVISAVEGQPAITKIRIGPYLFQPGYQPHPGPLGFSRGGPESAFWMHKRTPRGWGRLRWEVANEEPEAPAYLACDGNLQPGSQGLFQFISLYPPGGMRVGLEVYRGSQHSDVGVSGPNYERFLQHEH